MNRRSSPACVLPSCSEQALALCGLLQHSRCRRHGKEAPDEFAVLTKAPLVIPPDYNLMPPKPGAAPTNQTDPVDAAQTALFGNDPATIALEHAQHLQRGREDVARRRRDCERRSGYPQQAASDHKAMSAPTTASPTTSCSGKGQNPMRARPSMPTPEARRRKGRNTPAEGHPASKGTAEAPPPSRATPKIKQRTMV